MPAVEEDMVVESRVGRSRREVTRSRLRESNIAFLRRARYGFSDSEVWTPVADVCPVLLYFAEKPWAAESRAGREEDMVEAWWAMCGSVVRR